MFQSKFSFKDYKVLSLYVYVYLLQQVGDMVYCRLLVANKDMEPEVVCIDGQGRSSGMGVVRNGGFLFTTSLNLVRKWVSASVWWMVVMFLLQHAVELLWCIMVAIWAFAAESGLKRVCGTISEWQKWVSASAWRMVMFLLWHAVELL